MPVLMGAFSGWTRGSPNAKGSALDKAGEIRYIVLYRITSCPV